MSRIKDVAVDVAEKTAEKEKKKIKKKARKKVRRVIRGVLWTVLILNCGIFIGIHRKVILASIKGKELPKIPEWHKHCAK